jgi:tRNA U54 and U55 pseudouridine synthase Pus10
MELVDRYLKTVGSYLPKEQKEDILRELSENIRSEIEDKEAELGRPLIEVEQEAIVKRQGNPLLVAGRYRQEERSVAFGRE